MRVYPILPLASCGLWSEGVSLSIVNKVNTRVYPFPPLAGCKWGCIPSRSQQCEQWIWGCISFYSQQRGRKGVSLSTSTVWTWGYLPFLGFLTQALWLLCAAFSSARSVDVQDVFLFHCQYCRRAGCTHFESLHCGRAGCIHLHRQQYWGAGCIHFHRLMYGRPGCVKCIYLQFGRAACRVYAFSP